MHLAARQPTVVAIPARNEAERIEACLRALGGQVGPAGGPLAPSAIHVALLINNTTDDTAAIARRWAQTAPIRLEVRELTLPPEHAHAGGARGAAMDWAAELAGPDGLICTTDADSQVAPDWMARTWAAFAGGVDAVAGVVSFDPAAVARPFSPIRRMEARYAALQAEVTSRLDPEDHDPWPNHLWAWGASLAVRAAAYRAIGGLPDASLAEDRALAGALRRHDFKIRHALDVRVVTSCREEGRAPGGLADLIRDYGCNDDAPCDAALEPITTAVARAANRRRFKAAYGAGADGAQLARRLAVSAAAMGAALAAPGLGAGWAGLEDASPRLDWVRVTPARLSREVALAERILKRLRARDGAGPDDSVRAASAGLWSVAGQPAR